MLAARGRKRRIDGLEATLEYLELLRSGPRSRWHLYRLGPLTDYRVLSRRLGSMVSRGLIVEEVRVANGRRVKTYRITDKGRRLLELLGD
jgi:DNA-binding PadR family transcriptional regulator